MTELNPERIRSIRSFPSLMKFLREELDWRLDAEDVEDLTFEYEPDELGIDPKLAVKIKEIRQLRPFAEHQPWGIFYLSFEPRHLPVMVLRRILQALVIKKRQTAAQPDLAAWRLHDLLFISSYGEPERRAVTFAHFCEETQGDLPTLKVIGWDAQDTLLHMDRCIQEIGNLRFDPELSPEQWRKNWAGAFTLKHREVIRTSKALAAKLAELALRIRKSVNAVLAVESQDGPMKKLFRACFDTLIHDLDEDRFADMFAQTIAYGLFSARCSRKSGALIAENLKDMIPETNLFLRELLSTFFFIGGRKGKIDFDELGINDVVEMLRDTDMDAVLRDFGDKNPSEDPVIHFYEDFLKQYDAHQKVKRGAFYTPRPVVSFIVRSVHEILKKDFALADGLADTASWGEVAARDKNIKIPEGIAADLPFVQILDPATGTGTFLVEVIDLIYKTMREKWEWEGRKPAEIRSLWNEYVPKHLLPRMYGFELMMAPYSIAHMKIALKLLETGYLFDTNEVIRIYLTNSLEPAKDNLPDYLESFSPALAHEAKAANHVKKNVAVTVVVGNPPYSVSSINKSLWIEKLTADYKKDLNERNIQPLSDDYIKFIRFGQHLIDNTGEGILAYISNNSFIDGIIHRQMRKHLIENFDKIYISDLHGNSKKKEVAPDGSKDENVFDIMQGVSINIFIKTAKKYESYGIFYLDLWGKREFKYKTLNENSFKNIEWNKLEVKEPNYFLVKKYFEDENIYSKGFKIDIFFCIGSAGIKTHRDEFVIDFDKFELSNRIIYFFDSKISDDEIKKSLKLKDNRDWQLSEARLKSSFKDDRIQIIQYRPFDYRMIYYDGCIVDFPKENVMKHIIKKNIAIMTCRQQSSFDFQHVLISKFLVDMCSVSSQTKETAYAFPLYLYPETTDKISIKQRTKREPNLKMEIVAQIAKRIDLTFTPEKEPFGSAQGESGTFAPIDILDYIYAVLHSPAYREKYKEFLKIDFPRVPYPKNAEIFWQLVHFGTELRLFHLLEHPKTADFITAFPKNGSSEVEKIRYDSGKVWINKNQYFENVPQIAWEFYIGGYQPAQKWLKDRKGRTLTPEDIAHYHKIIVALNQTHRIMQEIDETIETHGGL
ncbi:MAG: type ISP restriction/modification enzyme [Desulfococcaceae bacterium]